MQEFQFEAPRSVGEAVDLLAGSSGVATSILAGGTDLLVQMKTGLREPGLIVDVKRIPELISLSIGADEICIGASVPAQQITENRELADLLPGLVEATDLIGSTQIQGRASLGGNLCNSSPAADTVPALITVGAEAVVVGGAGERRVPVSEFTTGPGQNVLQPGEFLVELRIPRPPARTADAYLRFIPRSEMDIAVVGAGVCLTLDESGTCTGARVALGAVGPTVFSVPAAADALIGTTVDAAALEAAGAAASAAASPIDDKRGTIEYRKKVSGVLTRRAAAIAAARAQGRS